MVWRSPALQIVDHARARGAVASRVDQAAPLAADGLKRSMMTKRVLGIVAVAP
jgi:hypothetical protein